MDLLWLKMYDALVAPYFDYCSEVWGCMGKGLCDRLQRLQNRAGRIITFSDYNTRSADILQDLRWDTLEQRRSKQLAINVFKSLKCTCLLGQSRVNASIAAAPGSGFQATYGDTLWFSLGANMSILGSPI